MNKFMDSIPAAIFYGSEALYVEQCIGDEDFISYRWCVTNHIGIDDVIWKSPATMRKDDAGIWIEITDIQEAKIQNLSDKDYANLCPELLGSSRSSQEEHIRGDWNKRHRQDKYETNPVVQMITFVVKSNDYHLL